MRKKPMLVCGRGADIRSAGSASVVSFSAARKRAPLLGVEAHSRVRRSRAIRHVDPTLDICMTRVPYGGHPVHVKGTFLLLPRRRSGRAASRSGRIINIASVGGLWPKGTSIPYGTSKAAVVHLSKCLAKTLGPEIRVNVIAPGFVPDARANTSGSELKAANTRSVEGSALKRGETPEEIAEIAVFFAAGADFVTGNVFVADGGRVFR